MFNLFNRQSQSQTPTSPKLQSALLEGQGALKEEEKKGGLLSIA
jgi:hypothetical protein